MAGGFMPGKRVAAAVLCLLAGFAAGYGWRGGVSRPKALPIGAPTEAPAGPEWINLFDAAHAGGWKNTIDDKDIFEIKDEILHIYGVTLTPLRYAGYVAEQFEDFDLHVEFKVAPGANSGMFLRMQPGNPDLRGFELQVADDHGIAPNKNSTGAVYDVVTPMFNMSLPAGEWNSFDVSVHGQKVIVVMNGWKIIDTDFAQMTMPIGKFPIPYANYPRSGIIAFQDHGGEAWYRNLRVRPGQSRK
jgi:hypothetical protein